MFAVVFVFFLSARKDSKGNLSLPDLPSKETPQVCDNKPTMEASVLLLITKSALSFFAINWAQTFMAINWSQFLCNQLVPTFYRNQLVPIFTISWSQFFANNVQLVSTFTVFLQNSQRMFCLFGKPHF